MLSMKSKDLPPPPPPSRQPKRELSLKAAMTVATKAAGHAILKPLMNPIDEFPSVRSGKQQDMEAHLLELQAEIINREELLNEKTRLIESRELEMNEQQALFEAQKTLLKTQLANPTSAATAQPEANGKEQEALEALRRELDKQEKSIAQGRQAQQDREAYIEECENALVEQSLALTQREAEIEQREEDFAAISAQAEG